MTCTQDPPSKFKRDVGHSERQLVEGVILNHQSHPDHYNLGAVFFVQLGE